MSASIEVRANDLRFHVLEEGRGDRLALFLHGFPQTSHTWRHQLPLLARLGYRAWAPDLRGYGRSERPPRTSDYAIERLIDDVDGLIEAGGRPATLIAHDWGAIIAWYVAMRRPEMLERLVILNLPHPGPLGRELRRGIRQLGRLTYAGLFQVPGLGERWFGDDGHRIDDAILSVAGHALAFREEDLAAYRRAALEPGAMRAMLSYYRAYVTGGGWRRQVRRGFPVIDTPTLMIWGEQDPILGRETTIGTRQWVSDLTVRYVPGAGHWVHEEAPGEVNAMLEAWLSDQAVPEAWQISP